MSEFAIDLETLLGRAIQAVEAEGIELAAEFHRPGGPRGARAKAPIDDEIEHRLRKALCALLPCTFVGEETGRSPGTLEGWYWLVDPHDATSDFLKRIPGSAISVALMRRTRPVLGVVHSPFAPGGGSDTFAWADGCGPIRRNGAQVVASLADRRLAPGERVWVTASAAKRAGFFERRVAPASLAVLPSIAHRLARVAAGEGVATLTFHPICEHDIAAGAAMVRAAGGVVLDGSAKPIEFSETGTGRYNGCFAGAPEAAAALAQIDWSAPS